MDRLEQMEIFCRVAERGSFSAVARDLYTSQPSISRAIQLLETRLGLRLFQQEHGVLQPILVSRIENASGAGVE